MSVVYCKRCGTMRGVVMRSIIAANGARMVGWHGAEGCEHWVDTTFGGPWIAHEVLKKQGIDPNEVPEIADYSQAIPCSRCGDFGTELHHWAPRAIFEDSERWPMDYLCRHCHDIWHLRVTPQLRNGRRAWNSLVNSPVSGR